MANLPPPVREFIQVLTDDTLAPGYLRIAENDGLYEWGGELESYGISGLHENMSVEERLLFLVGILPLESGNVFLPNVETQPGVYADVYLFRREKETWILFLDATAAVTKRRSLQQRTYDTSLRASELEQEGKVLLDSNVLLEQRVREQTRELSDTVLTLQQELADGRRTERALVASESRFRSFYDSDIIGIVFWDNEGDVTEANYAFLKLLGYSQEDLARGGIQWDRITEQETVISKMIEEPQIAKPQKQQFVRKDGESITLLFGESRVAGSSDKRVGFVLQLPS
ncbi:MAG: hypothetical protein C5B55_04590 [Blastocatellia bacterium]|nr:MAG: hypothetical protein C5B55_04590 [Blastocatellia bacterium]